MLLLPTKKCLLPDGTETADLGDIDCSDFGLKDSQLSFNPDFDRIITSFEHSVGKIFWLCLVIFLIVTIILYVASRKIAEKT